MNEWRIRQQKRRTAGGKVQDVAALPSSKTINLDAVKEEYVRCREEWKGKNTEDTPSVMSENVRPPDSANVYDDVDTSIPVESIRQEMLDIYRLYNPTKLGEIGTLLEKYKGEEEALLARIKKKYTHSPATKFAGGDLPGSRVFMEFDVDGAKFGRVRFRLYDSEVPLTVDNFRSLCTGEKV